MSWTEKEKRFMTIVVISYFVSGIVFVILLIDQLL